MFGDGCTAGGCTAGGLAKLTHVSSTTALGRFCIALGRFFNGGSCGCSSQAVAPGESDTCASEPVSPAAPE
eukprot:8357052-Pyramimonas_sp.AAC.1